MFFLRFLQELKALSSILITFEGIEMFLIAEDLKAFFPIDNN